MTALIVSFFAGFGLMGCIAVYQYVRHRVSLNSKEKIIKNLKEELNNLRNLSLNPNQQFTNETMIFNKDSGEGSALFQKEGAAEE